jgi:hypothetical protein
MLVARHRAGNHNDTTDTTEATAKRFSCLGDHPGLMRSACSKCARPQSTFRRSAFSVGSPVLTSAFRVRQFAICLASSWLNPWSKQLLREPRQQLPTRSPAQRPRRFRTQLPRLLPNQRRTKPVSVLGFAQPISLSHKRSEESHLWFLPSAGNSRSYPAPSSVSWTNACRMRRKPGRRHHSAPSSQRNRQRTTR